MINRESLAQILRVEYEFALRPVPVSGDMRPLWRLATICLILKNCRGGRTTLKGLHVLSWSIRDADNRETFLSALGDAAPVRPIIRIEPSLNRAINVAIGEDLVLRSSTRLELTLLGNEFARRIEVDPQILVDEKAFFTRIGRKVTAAMIDRVLHWNTRL
jgi:hypothetical protein